MVRIVPAAALAAVMIGCLLAQAPSAFDVATIKPAAPSTDGRTHTRFSTDTEKGQLLYGNVSLKEAIAKAFSVQQYQVSGPGYLESEHFDIVARFPPKSTLDQVAQMLQALLTVRFNLAVHTETKELPVYALIVTRTGARFKAAESESGMTTNSNRSSWHVVATIPMRRLAEFLTDQAGRPVLDRTGLAGPYEIKLDWTVDSATANNDAAAGPSLFTALQEQLGLKLNPGKGPVRTIVVDRADRVPTEN